MSALAEVVTIYDENLLNVPAKLRLLADDIEAGKYGVPGTCAVAMLADKMSVFCWGAQSDACSAHIVLMAGARMLEQPLLDHGQ